MKKITLIRPLLFLQIYANIWNIPKDKRNDVSVKEILTLPDRYISEAGYYGDGVLYLNDSLREQEEKIINSGFIVMVDFLKHRFAGMDELLWFSDAKHPRDAGIFTLQMKEEKLNLSLDYSGNKYIIGDPARADLRFGELGKSSSLRFTLNSKNDSHDQRKYLWFDYLFSGYEYVSDIVFDSANRLVAAKVIPHSVAKEVSMLKDIY